MIEQFSLMQMLMFALASLLTAFGCGLSDLITGAPLDSFEFENPSEPISSDGFAPESAAYAFLYSMTAGDISGASLYVCEAGLNNFFDADPDENLLLGADVSGLSAIVELDPDGTSGTLNFEGEVIVYPGTPDEISVPSLLIPYHDVPMFIENGVWVMCPADLLE